MKKMAQFSLIVLITISSIYSQQKQIPPTELNQTKLSKDQDTDSPYVPDTVYVKAPNGDYRKIYQYINDNLITVSQKDNLIDGVYVPYSKFEKYYNEQLQVDSSFFYYENEGVLELSSRHNYFYDSNNLLIKEDYFGKTVTYETLSNYDGNNNLISQERFTVNNGVKEKSLDIVKTYDEKNRITKSSSIHTNGNQSIHEYTYDDANKINTSFWYYLKAGKTEPKMKVVNHYNSKDQWIKQIQYQYQDTTEILAYEIDFTYTDFDKVKTKEFVILGYYNWDDEKIDYEYNIDKLLVGKTYYEKINDNWEEKHKAHLEYNSDKKFVRGFTETKTNGSWIQGDWETNFGPIENCCDDLTEHGYEVTFIYNNPVTGIKETIMPDDFELSQNYPNPFNPTTTIGYKLSNNSEAKIEIYSNNGELVRVYENLDMTGNRIEVDASNLASGVYYYVLRSTNKMISKKMLLIK